MKIKHLIATLQTLDPDAEVRGEYRDNKEERYLNLEVNFVYQERNWVTDKIDAVINVGEEK